jgi:hypothetical protein
MRHGLDPSACFGVSFRVAQTRRIQAAITMGLLDAPA